MGLFSFFSSKKKEDEASKGKKMKRGFTGASRTRFTRWINDTLLRINQDTNADQLKTIARCRDLAKNNPIVRSYLGSCVKNVIGKSGFTFQSQVKKGDSELDETLNDRLEWLYYDFGRACNGYITVDGTMRRK